MKGTIKRGKTLQEDVALQHWLQNDEKNRAENLMIVDLLRNDLGRIAEIGSVKVPEIFTVEKYETLFQMISTVEAKVRQTLSYYDIFRALFPCGSVTGAPKIRAMKIINELEQNPRGIYTGAIGFFSPEREAVFNVAIRTVVIDNNNNNNGEMGSGGGIVWDSIPENEYNECKLKARFLIDPVEEFELIETILWYDGYCLLEKHVNRMADSARYFDYPLDVNTLITRGIHNSQQLKEGEKYKVRLKLNNEGILTIENTLINVTLKPPYLIILSDVKTSSDDRFLYHKTTKRQLYDRLFQKVSREGYSDIVFCNEHAQITEGAISNIFIRKGERFLTPPLKCGLINGVFRQYLFDVLPNVAEKELYLDALLTADQIFICNAIKGLRKVRLSV